MIDPGAVSGDRAEVLVVGASTSTSCRAIAGALEPIAAVPPRAALPLDGRG